MWYHSVKAIGSLEHQAFLPLGTMDFFGIPNSDSESEFISSIFLGLGDLFILEGVSDDSFAVNYVNKY